MNVKGSILKLFSGNVAIALLQFGAIAGFTKLLGAGAMGSFFVFQAVIGMLGIPIDLGVSRAAEKHLSAEEAYGEVIATAVVVKAVLLLPWLFALLLAGPYVEDYVGVAGVLPLVVAGLAVNQTKRLSLRFNAGQMQVEQNALLRVLGKAAWVVAGFGLIAAGWDAGAIILAFILGDAVIVAGALVRMEVAVGVPRLGRARELADFGRYVLVGNVGGYIYQWMDVAVLRLFVGVELVGAYELAWRVASISMMLTKAIRTSLFPQISSWYADERLGEIEAAFYRWLQIPLYLTIPAFAGAVVLGEDILRTVFEAEVVVAYPVLLVFFLEKILRSVQLVLGPSLFAMDKPQLGYRGSVVAIVTNLGLNVTLIPAFGLMGAAVATTVSAASAAAVNIRYVSRFVDIRVPWPRVAWSALSATCMAVVVLGVRVSLPPGWTRLVACLGTGVACYFALLLANGGIRLEMLDILAEFRESSASSAAD